MIRRSGGRRLPSMSYPWRNREGHDIAWSRNWRRKDSLGGIRQSTFGDRRNERCKIFRFQCSYSSACELPLMHPPACREYSSPRNIDSEEWMSRLDGGAVVTSFRGYVEDADWPSAPVTSDHPSAGTSGPAKNEEGPAFSKNPS
jgi:hypothetical protein